MTDGTIETRREIVVGEGGCNKTSGNTDPQSVAPITFALATGEEILRFERDAFYIRGVRIEGGPGEAAHVHRTFMEWFTTGVAPGPKVELLPWRMLKPGDRVALTVEGSYNDGAQTVTFAEANGIVTVDPDGAAEVLR